MSNNGKMETIGIVGVLLWLHIGAYTERVERNCKLLQGLGFSRNGFCWRLVSWEWRSGKENGNFYRL